MTLKMTAVSRRSAFIASLMGMWLGAGYSLYREALPYFAAQPTALGRVDAVVGAPFEVGLSSYSHDMVLEDCKSALMSPISRLTMSENGLSGARSCEATAAAILNSNPTNGFAAFVGAYAEAMLGHDSTSRRLLALSHRLTPSEGWLASLRLRMIRQRLLPDGDRLVAAQADIRVLGTIYRGRKYLAEWYVQDLESRSAISTAVGSLSEAHQQSFLTLVRMLAHQPTEP